MLSKYDPYKTVDRKEIPLRLVCLVCKDGYNSPGHIDVPPWLADRGDITTFTKGWELVSGSVVVVQALDIPGHHFEPFQPQNVSNFSFFKD